MKTQFFVLNGTDPVRQDLVGNSFRLLTASAIDVRLYRKSRVVYEMTAMDAGTWAEPDGGFDAVEVSGAAQTVKAGYSLGRGGLDTISGTVNTSPLLGNVADNQTTVTVGTTQLSVKSATTTGRADLFMADPSNTAPIFIGGLSTFTVAQAAIRLEPGDIFISNANAQGGFHAISTAANQILRRLFTRRT